jgi:predicted RNA methylase
MEKKTEIGLFNELIELGWNEKRMYHTPSSNDILKDIFSKASKTGKANGIPDLIYFDENTLICFECKKDSIDKAINDLKIYKSKMKPTSYIVFFVAVSGMNIKVFDTNFNELDITRLYMSVFGIKKKIKYIRDISDMERLITTFSDLITAETKLLSEHKPLFLCSLLLAIREKLFRTMLLKGTKKDLVGAIKIIMEQYDIKYDFSDLNNNKIYTLSKWLVDNLKDFDGDLLNLFYTEFVKYGGSDNKSLGIVLTPDYIVELMVRMLEIKNTDTVIDLCTGTGSFLCEALKYNPKKIIGIEQQYKLYTLFKVNMILRNVENYKAILGNCFKQTIKGTKSVINPPYNIKDESEFKFIFKQLNSIQPGGECCAIIPTGVLNSLKSEKYKKEILKNCWVKCIIKCNKDLFKPAASIQTYIIHIVKKKSNEPTLFIDNSNDYRTTIIHNGRIETEESRDHTKMLYNIMDKRIESDISYFETLNENKEWVYNKPKEFERAIYENEKARIEFEYKIEIEKLIEKINIQKIQKIEKIQVNKKKYTEYKLSELFEIVRLPSVSIKNTKPGKIALVSASHKNNGVCSYIQRLEYEPNPKGLFTISKKGQSGMVYRQKEDFYITNGVKVLRLKINVKDKDVFATVLSAQLVEKYDYSRALNDDRFNKETVLLPKEL